MKLWLKQICRLMVEIRERESAQRKFMQAVYGTPSRFPADYDRPAYLRKARGVARG